MSGVQTATDIDVIRDRALFVRQETIRLISIAKTGHYASAFSAAEIIAALYYGVLRLRRGDPSWPDRDRFLLGKGHAAVAVYPVLADLGFLDRALLDEYTRLGNPLGDHPDMRRVPGIDFSSGSLGHALSAGLGMVLAARITGRDFRVFVLLGDGELHEGQVWEAALAAAHHRAGSLIAIVDRNRYSLDGEVDEVMGVEPVREKWSAFGWETFEVDGHDPGQLLELLRDLRDGERTRPALVVANTVKGKGISFMEDQPGWHLGWLHPDDERAALEELRKVR
ncbi:MAG TPA: transketolase [Candidatus Angelobacter sp.]|nr:transketolase [Candidatus Angelobacter sp.]